MIKKINDFFKEAENMNKKMLMDTFDLFDKNDVVPVLLLELPTLEKSIEIDEKSHPLIPTIISLL